MSALRECAELDHVSHIAMEAVDGDVHLIQQTEASEIRPGGEVSFAGGTEAGLAVEVLGSDAHLAREGAESAFGSVDAELVRSYEVIPSRCLVHGRQCAAQQAKGERSACVCWISALPGTAAAVPALVELVEAQGWAPGNEVPAPVTAVARAPADGVGELMTR